MKSVSQVMKSFASDTLFVGDKTAVIIFTHNGQEYELVMPYSKSLGGGEAVTSNYTFTASSGETLFKKRHPHIPLCVTPDDLGYKSVSRIDEFGDGSKLIEQFEVIGYE